jgi:dTDP-4-amino-4,6-dideoxygalactose transaminase
MMQMNSNDKNYTKMIDKYVTGKILVTRSSMPEYEEYCEEIRDIWDTHWLTNMGPKHKKLQEDLKNYLDVEQLDLLTNGHMALELTMQALGLTGEVITTPFTFASTTHAIVRNGLTPVFCDIDPDNFTIDTTKLESLITDKTSAIVPVHVYGNICNIEEIQRIADKYGLKVIYDAAHTFGETYKGKGIGSYGDVSCFSFHATKVFNTIEGGAVCFKDPAFGNAIYDLKNFGIHGPEIVESVGANAKMNEFCAAMGICNLRHVDDEINKRRAVVERYHERLENTEGIRLNKNAPDVKPNYAYLPIIIEPEKFGCDRDEVYSVLAEHNIFARKYFYPLTNTFDCFNGKFDPNDTPIALKISKQVLTLPLYADLEQEQVDLICDIILSCKK